MKLYQANVYYAGEHTATFFAVATDKDTARRSVMSIFDKAAPPAVKLRKLATTKLESKGPPLVLAPPLDLTDEEALTINALRHGVVKVIDHNGMPPKFLRGVTEESMARSMPERNDGSAHS